MSKSDEKTMTGAEMIAALEVQNPKLPDQIYHRLMLGSFRVNQAQRIFEEAGRLIIPGEDGRNTVVAETEFRRKMKKIKREKLPEAQRSQANDGISLKMIAGMQETLCSDLLRLAACVQKISVRLCAYGKSCPWWSGFDLAMYKQQLISFVTIFMGIYEDVESKHLFPLEEVRMDFLVGFQNPISDVEDAMLISAKLIVKLMQVMVRPSGTIIRVAGAYLNSVPGFKDETDKAVHINKLFKLIEKYAA